MIRTELPAEVRLARDLIVTPSISETPQQNEVQQLIRDDFTGHGIPARIDQTGNVIAQLTGANPKRMVMFLTHPDVVKATGDAWPKNDPFSGHIENGILWGRGTVDMKGAIAAGMHAMYRIKRDYDIPPCTIRFVSAVNEETSGDGARAIGERLERDLVEFDEVRMIVTEATGLSYVMYGHKGQIPATARVEGKALHASKVHEAKPHPLFVIARFAGQIERANTDWLRHGNAEFGPPTATISHIRDDGGSHNQISGFAEADVDIRTIPGFEKKAHERLNRIEQAFKNEGLELTYLDEFPPALSQPESEIFNAAKTIKPDIQHGIFTATSDAGQVLSQLSPRNQKKVQFGIVGPGDFSLAHQEGEHIRLDDIEKAADFYTALIKELAK